MSHESGLRELGIFDSAVHGTEKRGAVQYLALYFRAN